MTVRSGAKRKGLSREAERPRPSRLPSPSMRTSAKSQRRSNGNESHAHLYEALKNATAGICRGDEPPGRIARYWLLATVQEYDDADGDYKCTYHHKYWTQLEQWEILGGRLEFLRATDPECDRVANRIVQRPGGKEWVGISFPSRHGGRGFACLDSADAKLPEVRAKLRKQSARFEDLDLANLLVWMPTIVVVDKEPFDPRRLDHLDKTG